MKIGRGSLVILFCIFFNALAPGPVLGACCLDPSRLGQLVKRFAPVLVQGEVVPATPQSLLYRARTSEDCRTLFLAYHVVWPYEEDLRPGFYPTITRLTYTGGLKFQRIIYGPGDVEVIGLEVDLETNRVVKVTYETADYDKKGNVIHVPVALDKGNVPGYVPLVFKVVSWNHMFALMPDALTGEGPQYRLSPEPFTAALWKHYRMTKKIKGPLSLDRAHYPWEVEDICPLSNPKPASP